MAPINGTQSHLTHLRAENASILNLGGLKSLKVYNEKNREVDIINLIHELSKTVEELEQKVSDLSGGGGEVDLTNVEASIENLTDDVTDLKTSSSVAGPKGDTGSRGPQGPRGPKGDASKFLREVGDVDVDYKNIVHDSSLMWNGNRNRWVAVPPSDD